MRTQNSDSGRHSPGGGRVRCREYAPIKKRHIRSSGRTIYHDLLIQYCLYVAWTGGPVVEFRLLHTVVAGSISSGGDHGVHCGWDPIRSKQLFSAPYVECRCLPDFLVMAISNIIYKLFFKILLSLYIYIYMYKVKESWRL